MPGGRPARPAAAASIQSSKEPSRELQLDLFKLLPDLSPEFLEQGLGARIQGPFGAVEGGGSGGVAGGSLLWQGCSASTCLRGEL